MSRIKCIAFDCFGTVFDMTGVPREEIKAYVNHVRRNDFSPYQFPDSWYTLKAHRDAARGIFLLRWAGYRCVVLSNGSWESLSELSRCNGILWDHIVDLVEHRVYKPHVDAYRTIEKDLGIPPEETLMVTANPTFGDIEGAAAVGMRSQVIRQPGTPQTIIELAAVLASENAYQAKEGEK